MFPIGAKKATIQKRKEAGFSENRDPGTEPIVKQLLTINEVGLRGVDRGGFKTPKGQIDRKE